MNTKHSRKGLYLATALFFICSLTNSTLAQTKKPNILVIWGDDIGVSNISAYSLG